ncbi:hypothetical protein B0T26DRAFT_403317 [Lasiosphaeria miniovina]|uniref:Uncharacterized protein n=1 Tax=Lasiosphaeria miniovina TaxID=1954250 RepID=A0AA40A4Y0_9PEZI|nr:uncharacterized protein B0T26DRAFT_403317 [Lasiosphaeria miniovina]KAK0709337.1 hypothetical protein B0T26DRAFT_403317 [Lasiosphaeria miniovina]
MRRRWCELLYQHMYYYFLLLWYCRRDSALRSSGGGVLSLCLRLHHDSAGYSKSETLYYGAPCAGADRRTSDQRTSDRHQADPTLILSIPRHTGTQPHVFRQRKQHKNRKDIPRSPALEFILNHSACSSLFDPGLDQQANHANRSRHHPPRGDGPVRAVGLAGLGRRSAADATACAPGGSSSRHSSGVLAYADDVDGDGASAERPGISEAAAMPTKYTQEPVN